MEVLHSMMYPYPGGLTELPEVSSTGMEVLQNFQKFRVLSHRRTELTEVAGGYKT